MAAGCSLTEETSFRLFAFIDRSNIGNARIVGLADDLGIAQGTGFNVALLVFYILYILVDIPVRDI